MSNTYANNITRLAELAFQAYGRSIGMVGIAPAAMFAGFDGEDVEANRIVFNCDDAEPDGHADDAVWACQVEVQLVTKADDVTPEDHHDWASTIFSQFMIGREQTINALNQAAAASGIQFFCQDILPGRQMKETQDRSRMSSLVLRVVCSGIAGE